MIIIIIMMMVVMDQSWWRSLQVAVRFHGDRCERGGELRLQRGGTSPASHHQNTGEAAKSHESTIWVTVAAVIASEARERGILPEKKRRNEGSLKSWACVDPSAAASSPDVKNPTETENPPNPLKRAVRYEDARSSVRSISASARACLYLLLLLLLSLPNSLLYRSISVFL